MKLKLELELANAHTWQPWSPAISNCRRVLVVHCSLSLSRTRAEIAIAQGNALRIYGSKSDCHQNKKKIDIAARLSLLILLLFALSN